MATVLRKTSQFYSDLVLIVDYIAAEDETAAVRFLDAVEETIEMLRRMPKLGTGFPTNEARFENLRRITIRRFRNYLLFYDFRSDEVLILRIVHGAKDMDQII